MTHRRMVLTMVLTMVVSVLTTLLHHVAYMCMHMHMYMLHVRHKNHAAAEALSTSPPVWPSSSPWARGAPLALTPSCSTIGRTRQRRPSPTPPARIANKRAGRREDQRSFVGSLLPRRKEGWTRKRWRVGETVGRQEGCRLSIEFRPLPS